MHEAEARLITSHSFHQSWNATLDALISMRAKKRILSRGLPRLDIFPLNINASFTGWLSAVVTS